MALPIYGLCASSLLALGDALLSCDRDVIQLLQTQAASSGLPAALLATQHVCSVLGNCWRGSGHQHTLNSEEKVGMCVMMSVGSGVCVYDHSHNVPPRPGLLG